MTTTLSLGEALPLEIARVLDEVMPAYVEIGRDGAFALTLMQLDLQRAAHAIATGDVALMAVCYEALKGYSA